VVDTSYGDIGRELEAMGVTRPGIAEVSRAVINIRRSKLPDPAEIGNSGSFFKNPEVPTAVYEALKARFPDLPAYVISEEIVKIPAAWLIDRAGWKGKRFGNYGVHDKQALVLVNHGGALGSDIYALSGEIMDSVREVYGIELEREVNVV
jgi:UDP-N-acetylmuramate dehydrogenase